MISFHGNGTLSDVQVKTIKLLFTTLKLRILVETRQSTFLAIKYFGLSMSRKTKQFERLLIKTILLILMNQGSLRTMKLRMERMKIFMKLNNGQIQRMSLRKCGFRWKLTLISINFMEDFNLIFKKEQHTLFISRTTGMQMNGTLKRQF